MRGSGLKIAVRKRFERKNELAMTYTCWMMLTLDYGIAGHLLDEAPFFARIEVEVEGIYGRDKKK
jgi:hypothetical protein